MYIADNMSKRKKNHSVYNKTGKPFLFLFCVVGSQDRKRPLISYSHCVRCVRLTKAFVKCSDFASISVLSESGRCSWLAYPN